MESEVLPQAFKAGETPQARGPERFGVTAALSIAYLLFAFACLIQWGTTHPWSRVNLFSGGYFALRFLGTLHSLASSRRAFRSRSLTREWWGQTSNPTIVKWVILLMSGDLTVFLDYGHWHVASSLERPALQVLGLALYLFTAVWQIWTDSYLARHFKDDRFQPSPTVAGPFRHIRHPRYAAAILGKIGLALVFASLLGWLLLLPWTVLLLNKVNAEEVHLRKMFGAGYEDYARKTSRLLPGIY